MPYNLKGLCGRCDDKSGCISTHVSFVSDPQLFWRCWLPAEKRCSFVKSLCWCKPSAINEMLTDTTHAPLLHLTCNKWVCTYCIMSLQCAQTHTGHHPSVGAGQLEYFGFILKPVDSRSIAPGKRCNNSVSEHMIDSMAEESALSMTHLYTHLHK